MNKLSVAPHIYPTNAIGVAPVGHDVGRFDYRNRSDAKMGEWINVQDLDGFFFIAGIYEIHCEPTDSYYIGQSHNIHSRILQHVRQLRRNDHDNRAFQIDWNTFEPGSFRFRVIKEMPGSTEPERKQIEQGMIDERRDSGIIVYSHTNSRDTEAPAPDPEPDVDGIPLSDFMEAMVQPRNDNIKREAAACVTCKKTGYYLEGFYMCDDGEIRCETCCESRSEGLIGWLSTQQRNGKAYSTTVRRWILEGRSHKQEVTMALASYHKRFGTMPEVVYLSEADGTELKEVAGIPVRTRAVTPGNHLDIPIPAPESVTQRLLDALSDAQNGA